MAAADKIDDASSKSYALRYIAQAAAQTGDTTQAWAYLQQVFAAADKIEEARYKSSVLREIAQAAAPLENRPLLEDISKIIPDISGLEYQSVVQEALVAAWLHWGEYRKAYHLAHNISLSNAKLKALAFLNLMKAHKEGEAFEPVVIEKW